MSGMLPRCVIRECKHFWNFYSRSVDFEKWEEARMRSVANCDCAAFPNGIPIEIAFGGNDHTSPYEGDNGIQYEPTE